METLCNEAHSIMQSVSCMLKCSIKTTGDKSNKCSFGKHAQWPSNPKIPLHTWNQYL